MGFDIGRIVSEMGIFALLIVGTLAVMALAALSVFIERMWTFRSMARRSRVFSADVGALLLRNDYQALEKRCAEARGLPFADVLGGGAKVFIATDPHSSQVARHELVRREVVRRIETAGANIRRGLGVLASVGSVSPFVGLLGTVVGIIDAFEGIAAEGSGGLGAVSAGIAEALVVTAFGLLIAIPSVLMFNALSARVDQLLLGLNQAASEFVDHVEARAPRGAAVPAPNGASHGPALAAALLT